MKKIKFNVQFSIKNTKGNHPLLSSVRWLYIYDHTIKEKIINLKFQKTAREICYRTLFFNNKIEYYSAETNQ